MNIYVYLNKLLIWHHDRENGLLINMCFLILIKIVCRAIELKKGNNRKLLKMLQNNFSRTLNLHIFQNWLYHYSYKREIFLIINGQSSIIRSMSNTSFAAVLIKTHRGFNANYKIWKCLTYFEALCESSSCKMLASYLICN